MEQAEKRGEVYTTDSKDFTIDDEDIYGTRMKKQYPREYYEAP